jgi:hypothetical protein
MGSNTEFESAKSVSHAVSAAPTRPTNFFDKKPVPQKESSGQSSMATIADDDDRLLVRIGYTPVRGPTKTLRRNTHWTSGLATAFLTMVYRFLRDLDPRSARIGASNIRRTDDVWRPCNMCLGMVYR